MERCGLLVSSVFEGADDKSAYLHLIGRPSSLCRIYIPADTGLYVVIFNIILIPFFSKHSFTSRSLPKMKASFVLSYLATLAAAAPAAVVTRDDSVEITAAAETFVMAEIEAVKGARASSIYRDELINGNSARCPKVIFIFARGSLELDNMVRNPRHTSSPPLNVS